MPKKQQRSAESWRYVLTADRELPPEEQSVFVLRPLTQLERADVQDNMVRIQSRPDGGRTVVQRDHRLSVELCLTNITSIENFPAGAPEKWPADHASRVTYLEMLDDDHVQQIGNEIWVHSTITSDVKLLAAKAHVSLGRRLGGAHLYDCSKCNENPNLKALLGHDGRPTGLWRENLISGDVLQECPLRTLLRAREDHAATMQELDRYRDTYYPAYQDGHLLVAGGVSDQPARYLAMILALRDSEHAMQRKYDEVKAAEIDMETA